MSTPTPETDSVKVDKGRGIWIVNAEYMAVMERQRDGALTELAAALERENGLREALNTMLTTWRKWPNVSADAMQKASAIGYAAIKPPVGGMGGSIHDWERGKSPWHKDAFPPEFKSAAPEQEDRKEGWYALDAWGNTIGFVTDEQALALCTEGKAKPA